MPSTTTSVLWRSSHLAGCEYATLTAHDGGASIEGTVLLPVRQRPSRITYRVDVDPAWRTRRCVAEIAQAGRSTQLVV